MESTENTIDVQKEYDAAYNEAKKKIYADSYQKSMQNTKKTTNSILIGCVVVPLGIIVVGIVFNLFSK